MTEKRKLHVDLDELAFAFMFTHPKQGSYLDLETSQVITVTDETRWMLEKIYEEIYDSEAGELTMSLEAYLAQADDIQDWEKQCLLDANRVETASGNIVAIDPERYADYRDMERFISTVDDPQLRERLWRAIKGRGAFRYLKDVLADHPEVEDDWYAFKDAQIENRMHRWLEANGFEAV
jgi:hypothetical protein